MPWKLEYKFQAQTFIVIILALVSLFVEIQYKIVGKDIMWV